MSMEIRKEARGTKQERRRFFVALAVYVLWVAALGVLAVVSGQKPAERPAAVAE